jgi:hypothetical protein
MAAGPVRGVALQDLCAHGNALIFRANMFIFKTVQQNAWRAAIAKNLRSPKIVNQRQERF